MALTTGGALQGEVLLLLGAASASLYHGGMALNDFADRALDARERPERPIPRGEILPRSALVVGLGLLILGVLLAGLVSIHSGLAAAILALAILLYDFRGRRLPRLRPLLMGLCRGLNLLLFPAALILDRGASCERSVLVAASVYGVWIALLTRLAMAEVSGLGSRSFRSRVHLLSLTPLLLLLALPHRGLGIGPILLLLAGLEWVAQGRTFRSKRPAARLAEEDEAIDDRRASPEAVRRTVSLAVRGTLLFDAGATAGAGALLPAAALLLCFVLQGPIARRLPVT